MNTNNINTAKLKDYYPYGYDVNFDKRSRNNPPNATTNQKVVVNVEELHKLPDFEFKTPDEVNDYFHNNPISAGSLPDGRDAFYESKNQHPTVSELYANAVEQEIAILLCRERAIFAHLVLAQMGIPSIIVSANNNNGRHAFVVFMRDVINMCLMLSRGLT